MGGGASVVIVGNSGAITISTPPDTEVQKAIKALEGRIGESDCRIELTRAELEALTRALKELDERTSGMEKLPDGRTRYAGLVGGSARVVFEGLEGAAALYSAKNYTGAVQRIESTIQAFEETERMITNIVWKPNIIPSNIDTLYFVGTMACLAVAPSQNSNAYYYAKRSLQENVNSVRDTYYTAPLE
jgi:hypothetical protein